MSDLHYFSITSLDLDPIFIKKIYKDLVKKHHPDKQGGSTAAFQKIQQEYEYLIHKTQKRKKNTETESEGSEEIEEKEKERKYNNLCDYILNKLRSVGTDKNIKRYVYVSNIITLKELYIGKPIKVKVNGIIMCQECNGVGYDFSWCDLCKGLKCVNCDFRGIFVTGDECYNCKNTGKIEINKRILLPATEGSWVQSELKLPAKVNQTLMSLIGNDWQREAEFDLKRILNITLKESLIGTKKRIKLPSNEYITVVIPPITNTFLFRVDYTGIGLPYKSEQRGCLHFDINVCFPKNKKIKKEIADKYL